MWLSGRGLAQHEQGFKCNPQQYKIFGNDNELFNIIKYPLGDLISSGELELQLNGRAWAQHEEDPRFDDPDHKQTNSQWTITVKYGTNKR